MNDELPDGVTVNVEWRSMGISCVSCAPQPERMQKRSSSPGVTKEAGVTTVHAPQSCPSGARLILSHDSGIRVSTS